LFIHIDITSLLNPQSKTPPCSVAENRHRLIQMLHGKNMDSLNKFKEWCRKSFSFLKEYDFKESTLPNKKFINEYQVIFTKDNIKLIILGEGYGEIASVFFVSLCDEKVPYALLGNESKAHKEINNPTQEEQINCSAQYIKNNLENVLKGDYSLLIQLGDHFSEQTKKSKESFKKYLNDPEAQAEKAAISAISEAGHIYKSKNYKKFIELLEPHVKYLPKKQIERLEVAKLELKTV